MYLYYIYILGVFSTCTLISHENCLDGCFSNIPEKLALTPMYEYVHCIMLNIFSFFFLMY